MKLSIVTAIVACAAVLAFQAPARAQNLHSWVASNGNNANDCSRASPCASFQGAYSKTNAGGEITCVDSGDFGGSITGAGTLNKFTTGKLVLSGVNSHAGGTLISGGELRVDGSLGSGAVTVARLGTLSGTGTIAGTVTV